MQVVLPVHLHVVLHTSPIQGVCVKMAYAAQLPHLKRLPAPSAARTPSDWPQTAGRRLHVQFVGSKCRRCDFLQSCQAIWLFGPGKAALKVSLAMYSVADPGQSLFCNQMLHALRNILNKNLTSARACVGHGPSIIQHLGYDYAVLPKTAPES